MIRDQCHYVKMGTLYKCQAINKSDCEPRASWLQLSRLRHRSWGIFGYLLWPAALILWESVHNPSLYRLGVLFFQVMASESLLFRGTTSLEPCLCTLELHEGNVRPPPEQLLHFTGKIEGLIRWRVKSTPVELFQSQKNAVFSIRTLDVVFKCNAAFLKNCRVADDLLYNVA